MSKEFKPKWVLYHLVAMEYAKKRFKHKMSKLPSSAKIRQMDKKQLKKLNADIRKHVRWYQEKIESHREKAMKHFPDNKKNKWAKEFREKENKTYERLFIQEKNEEDFDLEFTKASELEDD